ncbi:MAG: hypothetical protein IT379_37710 [Deltaproteobacteria bacterium]|nr:hypothetical protein [Deltaproteobacteria bacterium]
MTDRTRARPRPRSLLRRRMFTTGAVVGLVLTAFGFFFKLTEFLYALEAEEVEGFVTVPVVTYFIVAAGYLLLFLWSWRRGLLKDLEAQKTRMLEMEEAYDRLEGEG